MWKWGGRGTQREGDGPGRIVERADGGVLKGHREKERKEEGPGRVVERRRGGGLEGCRGNWEWGGRGVLEGQRENGREGSWKGIEGVGVWFRGA